jgi:molybdopterin/thiamine biosynthesis adenylyltransferase
VSTLSTRRVVFPEHLYEQLRTHLLKSSPAEEAAVVLAGRRVDGERVDLLVREVHPVPSEGFATRQSVFLQVDSVWYAPLLKRCRDEGWSFMLTHSHPFGPTARFSGTDDRGERDLMPRLFARAADRPHGALVMGMERASARIWMPGDSRGEYAEIHVRGVRSCRVDTMDDHADLLEARFDRQVRALGEAGQGRLARAHVGLVGIGGLGAHVYQQLKYLGVQRVTVVDRDTVDKVNLNRLVYATAADVGRPKAEVALERGRAILPSSQDNAVVGDVATDSVVRTLLGCDLIITATDNLLSRTVVNRLMPQFLIPMVDGGIDLDVTDGTIRAIGGRVTRAIAGRPCLTCVGILDPVRVATEINRTYVAGVIAPSVVSFNGVVGSLLVNEVLDHFTGFAGESLELPRSLVYDGRRGTVRAVAESGHPCGVCDLVLAAGDVERLPVAPAA